MPDRLRVTPLEACIILVNETYSEPNPDWQRKYGGRGHYSEAVARALHGDYWWSWYTPERNPLTPDHIIHDAQRSQLLLGRVNEVLATLRDREQHLVRRRFGLDNGVITILAEVDDGVGCTRARAKQIIDNALRKLRHPSRSKYLREFLPV